MEPVLPMIVSLSLRGWVGRQQAHLSSRPLGFAEGSSTASLFLQSAPCKSVQFSSVQFSSVAQWCQLFATPLTAGCQTTLPITNSLSLPKLMSIESVTASNHFILCHPLLLLPSIFTSIRVFSNESALCLRYQVLEF